MGDLEEYLVNYSGGRDDFGGMNETVKADGDDGLSLTSKKAFDTRTKINPKLCDEPVY